MLSVYHSDTFLLLSGVGQSELFGAFLVVVLLLL